MVIPVLMAFALLGAVSFLVIISPLFCDVCHLFRIVVAATASTYDAGCGSSKLNLFFITQKLQMLRLFTKTGAFVASNASVLFNNRSIC